MELSDYFYISLLLAGYFVFVFHLMKKVNKVWKEIATKDKQKIGKRRNIKQGKCRWKLTRKYSPHEQQYITSCKHNLLFLSIGQMEIKYCPYCGREIEFV